MRSDAGFDRFISEGLKEAASRVEVPVRCKAEIDTRIMSAESNQQTGGTKQMRSWTFRKSAAAVVMCCLLIGTGVFAAGRIASVVSHGSSEPRVTEYAKIDELEAEAGFTMRTKEDFSNGFAFTGGGIVDTEGQDEQGNGLSSWKMISLTYRNAEDKELTIDAEQEASFEQDLSGNASETRTIRGTEVFYDYTEEEEERSRTDPHYTIAYGSDAPETTYSSTLCFVKDGVRYYITTFDDVSADELYLIAEELLE